MFERLLLLFGGVEMSLGALMAAFPSLFPQWLAFVMLAIGVVTTVAGGVLCWDSFLKWVLDRARRTDRDGFTTAAAFDAPDGWSLSFLASISVQGVAGPLAVPQTGYHSLVLRGVRIANLSTKYTRAVDVTLSLPDFNKDGSSLVLTTERQQELKYPQSELGQGGRISFPLNIPPGGIASGSIVFEIPNEVRERFNTDFFYTWDVADTEFICIDHVSGKRKAIYLGEEYDAIKDKKRITREESKSERLKHLGIEQRKLR